MYSLDLLVAAFTVTHDVENVCVMINKIADFVFLPSGFGSVYILR